MIHEHSILAYWEGREDLIPKRTRLVVGVLRNARGPLTDREVMTSLGFVDPNAVRPRITELVDAGIASEVDRVECPITRKTVRRVKLVRLKAEPEFDFVRTLAPVVNALSKAS